MMTDQDLEHCFKRYLLSPVSCDIDHVMTQQGRFPKLLETVESVDEPLLLGWIGVSYAMLTVFLRLLIPGTVASPSLSLLLVNISQMPCHGIF